MDMSSLQTGLPRPVADPANVAFKEAALKLTTLYKASQQSRHEGYLDAIDEIWARFLDGNGAVDTDKMKKWLDERRRKEVVQDTSDDAEMAAALQQSDALDLFETEAVVMPSTTVPSSPVIEMTTRNRGTAVSPVRRQGRPEASEGREEGSRRERNSVKRRVLGTGIDSIPDLHKRGRFG